MNARFTHTPKMKLTGDIELSDADEPLLGAAKKRLTLFPIQYGDMWRMYKDAEESFWTLETNHLESENHILMPEFAYILASTFNSPILRSISGRLSTAIQIQEARCYLGFKAMRTITHMEVYDKIRETCATNYKLDIQAKFDWIIFWTCEPDISFCKLLFIDTIVRSVFSSGALAVLDLLATSSVSSVIRRISCDIQQDREFAFLVYQHLHRQIDRKTVCRIVREAVILEQNSLKDAVDGRLAAQEIASVMNYIEFIGNTLIAGFGGSGTSNIQNPFPAMSLQSNIARESMLLRQWTWMQTLTLDDDF